MKKSPTFYSGMSGLVLPVPNKSHFPEQYRQKSRLGYYASLYNSIEINSSFYKVPRLRTVERWAQEVPDAFQFTFKLHRDITHKKGLSYHAPDVGLFLAAINGVGSKKGCLLVQLPGGTKFDSFGRLESLLTDLNSDPKSKGWKISIEFRDPSWYVAETWELLNEFKAGVVYQDMTKSVTPRVALENRWIYLRYHGPTGNYRGSYDNDRLSNDALSVKSWLKQKKTVYAYFNNTLGEAIQNHQLLRGLIGSGL